ncbi:SRPBCC family protein [Curtobacterium sp. MCPF17_001]|uniref:SRPBCC family protein n=1 Tax=Curtobacterium sp. MCPF17_001 TaxID=2175651 RepID=UPI000DAA76E5|nr:SRPBCC family protein [Curtobacterium sp. MCPF17_001]PZE58372.1 SRPBCC family protein [Curtobacterium sp. MCPF17_001]
MASRSIYVETLIDADVDAVWAATQDPRQHVRWDVRFSEIVPEPADTDGAARFTYVRRSALHDVHGTGISIGERLRDDGTRTSALRFATDDGLSPIRTGRGYWRYVPTDDGRTRFITGYDYDSGWGPLDLVVRPLLGWATAWSFDRLRVWLEGGAEPEAWPLTSVLAVWRRDRPRASRTRRAPVGGTRRADHLRDAPATLATLARPGGTS